MKAYNEYMDGIYVPEAVHCRIVSRAPAARAAGARRRYVVALACAALALACALAIPRLLPGGASPGPEGLIVSAAAGNSGYVETSSCYAVPEPGTCLFFTEVRQALAEYAGTDARLFLAIDIFTGEEKFDSDGEVMRAELERLAALGYNVAYGEAWTYQGRGEKVPYTYLAGLFTIDELENFAASGEYGYAFRFATNGDGSPVAFDAELFGQAGPAVTDYQAESGVSVE